MLICLIPSINFYEFDFHIVILSSRMIPVLIFFDVNNFSFGGSVNA